MYLKHKDEELYDNIRFQIVESGSGCVTTTTGGNPYALWCAYIQYKYDGDTPGAYRTFRKITDLLSLNDFPIGEQTQVSEIERFFGHHVAAGLENSYDKLKTKPVCFAEAHLVSALIIYEHIGSEQEASRLRHTLSEYVCSRMSR